MLTASVHIVENFFMCLRLVWSRARFSLEESDHARLYSLKRCVSQSDLVCKYPAAAIYIYIYIYIILYI